MPPSIETFLNAERAAVQMLVSTVVVNTCSVVEGSIDFRDAPNKRLARTRHERASLLSCVGAPLKCSAAEAQRKVQYIACTNRRWRLCRNPCGKPLAFRQWLYYLRLRLGGKAARLFVD
jgi:hypothetical protein